MDSVLILGGDGNAGINYAKSLRIGNPDFKIYATGIGNGQLHQNRFNFDGYFDFTDFNNVDKREVICSIIEDYNIKFVHAQPDMEVSFLADSETVFNASVEYNDALRLAYFHDKFASAKIFYPTGLDFGIVDESDETLDENIREAFTRHEILWVRATDGSGSKMSFKAKTFEDVKFWAEYCKRDSHSEIMWTEFLPGKEYAVQMYYIDSEIFHAQVRERVEYAFGRQMITGQSSSPSVAVIPEIGISNYVTELVDDSLKGGFNMSNFSGIFCVDLKENSQGIPIITELNMGRYFTTSDFFATIGMNTPYEQYKYLVDGLLPNKWINEAIPGTTWVRGMDTEPYLLMGGQNA